MELASAERMVDVLAECARTDALTNISTLKLIAYLEDAWDRVLHASRLVKSSSIPVGQKKQQEEFHDRYEAVRERLCVVTSIARDTLRMQGVALPRVLGKRLESESLSQGGTLALTTTPPRDRNENSHAHEDDLSDGDEMNANEDDARQSCSHDRQNGRSFVSRGDDKDRRNEDDCSTDEKVAHPFGFGLPVQALSKSNRRLLSDAITWIRCHQRRRLLLHAPCDTSISGSLAGEPSSDEDGYQSASSEATSQSSSKDLFQRQRSFHRDGDRSDGDLLRDLSYDSREAVANKILHRRVEANARENRERILERIEEERKKHGDLSKDLLQVIRGIREAAEEIEHISRRDSVRLDSMGQKVASNADRTEKQMDRLSREVDQTWWWNCGSCALVFVVTLFFVLAYIIIRIFPR